MTGASRDRASPDAFPDPLPDADPDPLPAAPPRPEPPRVRPTPGQALAGLVAGNQRFQRGEARYGHHRPAGAAATAAQHPAAVVLGCIDSRVPVEAVFDQDFGAVCAVRSGGHVLDRAVAGSVAFAVQLLRVPLVLVLGHTECGAVTAAVESARTGERPTGELGFLVDGIAPAVAAVGPAGVPAATREHVRRTAAALPDRAGIRGELAAGVVAVAGAVYDLATGRVTLLKSPA